MVQSESRLSTLQVGDLIDGRYEVQGHLGAGGMGDVWLVQHRELAQSYALKTLKPEREYSSERLQRFLREARAAAALHSRYIVRVVDGRTDYVHCGVPLPFIVMEYLKGQSVEDRVTLHGPCSPSEASWLLGCLGLALKAAHQAGLVHRDVKPANLFIADGEDGEPTVKLGDFGIVKLMDEALLADSAMTASGMLLGTPMYMAPEQLRGKREVGPQADQWSFAMVAFYVLTGRSYFEDVESMADLIASALSARLAAPSQKSPRFPAGLDAWFLRSCSQAPEERFEDVDEQVREFARLLGAPLPAPTASRQAGAAAERSGTPRAIRRLRLGIAAGILAAGVVLAWAWLNQDAAILALFPSAQRPPHAPVMSAFVATASIPATVLPPPLTSLATSPSRAEPESFAPSPAASARSASVHQPSYTSLAAASAQRHAVPPPSRPRAKASGSSSSEPALSEPRRYPSGASCARSAECQSGLCVAEVCR